MTDIVFVDTNILIYAQDRDAGSKRELAREALEGLWDARMGRLSTQVLQEFYVTVTQKLRTPLTRATAREVLRLYAPWVREPTTPDTVLRASELAELAQLSFWDGLIIASAEAMGATQLYSEDFNAGQTIAGVTIVNPLTADISPRAS